MNRILLVTLVASAGLSTMGFSQTYSTRFNGVEKARVTDDTFQTGNPGIGEHNACQNGQGMGSNPDFGFSSYTARGLATIHSAPGDPSPRFSNTITLLSPTPYVVFQRSASNYARIQVAGRVDTRVARVEANASLMPPYQEGIDGKSVGFVEIAKPNASEFAGELEVPAGGWYAITARAKNAQGNVIAQSEVRKVGVGEVFVAAGHSFCSNFQGDAPSKAMDDRVATCADWSDAPPVPLSFRHCDDPLRPGDENRASPWPAVGDILVAQVHVPVLFVCTGVGGSTVEGWRQGAEDPASAARGYRAFRLTLERLTPYTGLRAVAWFGNENDLGSGPTAEQFSDNLRRLIARSREDSGCKDLSWVIAFDAYDPGVVKNLGAEEKQRRKERLDRGTEIVLETVPQTFDGPQTDDLGPEFRRSDGDHFNEAGVRQLGIRFARKITQAFFPPPIPTPLLSEPSSK